MSSKSLNSFTAYNLSDPELLQGSILSPIQKQLIQTDLSYVAEQILNLTYNPSNPLEFAQQDAHLKGQMSVYRILLLRSDESEQTLVRLANQSSDFE